MNESPGKLLYTSDDTMPIRAMSVVVVTWLRDIEDSDFKRSPTSFRELATDGMCLHTNDI